MHHTEISGFRVTDTLQQRVHTDTDSESLRWCALYHALEMWLFILRIHCSVHWWKKYRNNGPVHTFQLSSGWGGNLTQWEMDTILWWFTKKTGCCLQLVIWLQKQEETMSMKSPLKVLGQWVPFICSCCTLNIIKNENQTLILNFNFNLMLLIYVLKKKDTTGAHNGSDNETMCCNHLATKVLFTGFN